MTYFRTSTVTVSRDSDVTKRFVGSLRYSMIFLFSARYEVGSN